MDEKRISVDFDAKSEARKSGAHVVNGRWMAKEDAPDEIHAKEVKENLMDLAKKLSGTEADAEVEGASLNVPEDCLCDESEDQFWENLLDYRYWNALSAVLKIKQCGLPRTTEQRAELLNRFASASSYREREQYNVCYKDVCDYCEKFDKAYNYKVIGSIKNHYGITGFNFEKTLNKGKLTEEEKALLRFVFPFKVQTIVKERYLAENAAQQTRDEEIENTL